jgi:hypothetical protein
MGLSDFKRRVAANPWMEYGGPYNAPEDLPGMYSRIDLSWNAHRVDDNNSLLWNRTNRFYEACAFRTPLVAQVAVVIVFDDPRVLLPRPGEQGMPACETQGDSERELAGRRDVGEARIAVRKSRLQQDIPRLEYPEVRLFVRVQWSTFVLRTPVFALGAALRAHSRHPPSRLVIGTAPGARKSRSTRPIAAITTNTMTTTSAGELPAAAAICDSRHNVNPSSIERKRFMVISG